MRHHVDYALARRAVLRDLRTGKRARLDVCDAQPELLRAARNLGRAARRRLSGVWRRRACVLVSYVYGDGAAPGQRSLHRDRRGARRARRDVRRVLALRRRGVRRVPLEPPPAPRAARPPPRRLSDRAAGRLPEPSRRVTRATVPRVAGSRGCPGRRRQVDGRDACSQRVGVQLVGSPRRRLPRSRVRGTPVVMVTAYDAPSARIADAAGVDVILVGDSLANVVLGYDDTLQVTIDDMEHHVGAVARTQPARARRRRPAVAQLPRLDRRHRHERGAAHPRRCRRGEARGRPQAPRRRAARSSTPRSR